MDQDQRHEHHQRRKRVAWVLRKAGKTYPQIADDLGVTAPQARKLSIAGEELEFLEKHAAKALSKPSGWLSVRTFNALRAAGIDPDGPTENVRRLVDTAAWKDVPNFGRKSRDELRWTIEKAKQNTLPDDDVQQAIDLLESRGYTVTPPP